MIKLKNLITEVVSKAIVRKVMQFRNPKFIEAEYILTRATPPRKEKEKFKVKKTYENESFYFITVGRVKGRPKEFNNFEFVIDKKKLNIKFRAKMGMMPNQLSDKILSIKVR
jgi:hypothetical protein|tara:strand:- start:15031 stop:15366 length:336 start_codon:yes stop_codon:yes gene_type:complete